MTVPSPVVSRHWAFHVWSMHAFGRAALAGAGLAAALTVSSSSRAAGSPTRLFCIERNKNANQVCYDVRLRKDGQLDRREPLVAYWVLRAEEGQREKLSWLERKAYGFSMIGEATESAFRFRLDALPGRVLTARRADDHFQAEGTLAGRPSRLLSIWVQADEGGPIPKVRYVDLTGTDLQNGQRQTERIQRK